MKQINKLKGLKFTGLNQSGFNPPSNQTLLRKGVFDSFMDKLGNSIYS